MPDSNPKVVWSACKDATGAPTIQNTRVHADPGTTNSSIQDLAESILQSKNFQGPFVHFEDNDVSAILSAASAINAFRPIVIDCSVDSYVEMVSNPDNMPLSILDYQSADNHIKYHQLSGLIADYKDSARHDEHGCWYVERGNVPKPTWQADYSIKSAHSFSLTSQNHGGLAINIVPIDGYLDISVYGRDHQYQLKPSSGGLKIDFDQLEIVTVPDTIEFEFEAGKDELQQYAYVKFLGVAVTIKQEDEGIVIDVSPDDFSEVIGTTCLFYEDINDSEDLGGESRMA